MMTDENKKIKRRIRSAYAVSTVSIALVLFLLGAVAYLTLGALNAADRLRANVAFFVMLKDGLTDEQTQQVGRRLTALPGVRGVEFTSRDQAAEEYMDFSKEGTPDNFMDLLEENPLPDSYVVNLRSTASVKDSIAALEKQIAPWTEVREVVYQHRVVEQIGTNINKFMIVLFFFGLTLLVISLILLNNTIRLTILSKRFIIKTMKLVGATRGFIMRPFLWNGVLQGIYAALIATIMLLLLIVGLSEGLPDVSFVTGNVQILVICGALLVGGVLISLLFTTFAVRRFIRMNSNRIQIY